MTSPEDISKMTDCFQIPTVFFRVGSMNHYPGMTANDEIVGERRLWQCPVCSKSLKIISNLEKSHG